MNWIFKEVNRLTDDDFLRFLKDDSWDYSREEVENILDEELEKDVEKIDMGLVDACMSYLSDCAEPSGEEETPNVKPIKPKRIHMKTLLVAAMVALLCVSATITAYAAVNDKSLWEVIVSIFPDHASIYYRDKIGIESEAEPPKEESELYSALKSGGISDIFLPGQLYHLPHDDIVWQYTDTFKLVTINYRDSNLTLTMQNFVDAKWVTNPDIQGEFSRREKVTVQGVDIYLFEKTSWLGLLTKTSVSYQVGLTQYFIEGEMTLEEAKELIQKMN